MAIGKAFDFIQQFASKSDFRNKCNEFASKEVLMTEYDFTELEFENALNSVLLKCQTADEALAVKEIRFWFMLL